MKKFIKRLLIFSFFFLLILFLKKAVTPYYLGNQVFAEKVTYFKDKPSDFNMVFFGSSMIYRHVNTIVLDSVLKEKNIHSYNFGSPATFNPESYFLYDNFIEQVEGNKIKYAVLEITGLSLFSENAATTQGSYWNNLPTLKYCVASIMSSEKSFPGKIKYSLNYLKSYVYSLYDIRIFKNRPEGKAIGVNGFYSLEDELNETNSVNIRERFEKFHSDTTELQKRIKISMDQESSLEGSHKIDIVHYNKLNNLLLKSKKKGVHLFFLIPPRLTKYSDIVPILNLFPQENTLSLYEYQKFQDLYTAENLFDIGHFNTKGANLFTNYVGNMIKEKLETNVEGG